MGSSSGRFESRSDRRPRNPPSSWCPRNSSARCLEHGLLIGGLVALCGVAIDAVIVGIWIDRGFGELSEERLLVFGSILIILGLQAIFACFFLSILGLARGDRAPNWPVSG